MPPVLSQVQVLQLESNYYHHHHHYPPTPAIYSCCAFISNIRCPVCLRSSQALCSTLRFAGRLPVRAVNTLVSKTTTVLTVHEQGPRQQPVYTELYRYGFFNQVDKVHCAHIMFLRWSRSAAKASDVIVIDSVSHDRLIKTICNILSGFVQLLASHSSRD